MRSVDNFDIWVQDVYQYYLRFGKKSANKFISHLKERYEPFQSAFLSRKIMWRCYDLHSWVKKNNQHQVYGFIGPGGYGKSTLAKNILYFHDETFRQERISTSLENLPQIIYSVIKRKDKGRYKGILVDEPSKEIHHTSLDWRLMEDVLGQMRQANLFLGIAATEISNIPRTLYNMITGLYAFRRPFIYDYYDSKKVPGSVGDVWKEYKKTQNYSILINPELLKKRYIKNQKSLKKTPIDKEQGKYNKEKRKAFIDKIEKLIERKKASGSSDPIISQIDEIIIKKKKSGIKQEEIAKSLDMTQQAVSSRLTRLKKLGVVII